MLRRICLVALLVLTLGALTTPRRVVSAQGQFRVFLPLTLLSPPPVIVIRNDSLYGVVDRQGSFTIYHLIGEVVNVSDRPFQNVIIRAEIPLPGWNGPFTTQGSSLWGYLAPGEVSPFNLTFSTGGSPSPVLRNYTLSVSYQEASFAPPIHLTLLSILFDPNSPTDQGIEGEIRNDTTETVQYPGGVVALYDSAGTLQAVYPLRVLIGARLFKPGETAPFDGPLLNRYDPSWTVRVVFEGELPWTITTRRH